MSATGDSCLYSGTLGGFGRWIRCIPISSKARSLVMSLILRQETHRSLSMDDEQQQASYEPERYV
jgi:hypothetical protein